MSNELFCLLLLTPLVVDLYSSLSEEWSKQQDSSIHEEEEEEARATERGEK